LAWDRLREEKSAHTVEGVIDDMLFD